MTTELEVLESALTKLNEDVGVLQAKIADAKARQNAIIVRGKATQSRLGVRRTLSNHNIDDAMARFELYERKIDDLEGEIEAYDMVQKTLADEIAVLETDEVVDAQRVDPSTQGKRPALLVGKVRNLFRRSQPERVLATLKEPGFQQVVNFVG